MFDPAGKSTGTSYTATVTLLLVAFLVIPILLLASSPIGYGDMALASAAAIVFSVLAWLSWRGSSRMSIPTIACGRSERR